MWPRWALKLKKHPPASASHILGFLDVSHHAQLFQSSGVLYFCFWRFYCLFWFFFRFFFFSVLLKMSILFEYCRILFQFAEYEAFVWDLSRSLTQVAFPFLPEFHPEFEKTNITDQHMLLLRRDLWDRIQYPKGNTCCCFRCRCVSVMGARSVGPRCFESVPHSQKNSRLLSVPLGCIL